jgi:hypothetical protein
MLALCAVLLDELDTAARWATKLREGSAGALAPITRLHLAVEALVALRRGRAQEARLAFDQSWAEIERTTAADLVRGLRIARAFAAEAEGGETAALAPDLLAGARPFRPGEYAWLSASWPEMARYLEAKGFAGPR